MKILVIWNHLDCFELLTSISSPQRRKGELACTSTYYVISGSASVTAIFSERWYDAVPLKLLGGEEFAVLGSVSGRADEGWSRGGWAAAKAAAAVTLAGLGAAKLVV